MTRLPPIARLALVCGAVLALLSPALRAAFVWDDIDQIVQSEGIRSVDLAAFFSHNVRESIGRGGVNSDTIDIYRPLFEATLAGTWSAAGGAVPAAFHLVSLLAHLLASMTVWLLARAWLGSRESWWPEVAALAFGLQPAVGGAYLFCSAVSEPLSVAALLGAVLLMDPGAEEGAAPPGWGRAAGAGALLFASLLYKETPLVAAPFLAGWLVWRRRVPVVRFAPAAVAALIYLGLRQAALGGLQAGGDGVPWLQALHRGPLVAAEGLLALVRMGPTGVRHLHSEFADVSWGVVALASLGLLVVAAAAWAGRHKAPVAPLFVVVHLATLAPVALVATVEGWGGFGRYLYLAWAIGAVAAAQIGGLVWASGRRGRGAVLAGAVVVLAVGQHQLRQGLEDWSDPEHLAQSGIRTAPEVGIHYCWLAYSHSDDALVAGVTPDLDLQVELTRTCSERSPAWVEAPIAYATALRAAGRPGDALEVLAGKDRDFGPGPRSVLLQAVCLMEAGRPDEAGDRLLWALVRAPAHDQLWQLQWEFVHIHPQAAAYRAALRDRARTDAELTPIAPRLLELLAAVGD